MSMTFYTNSGRVIDLAFLKPAIRITLAWVSRCFLVWFAIGLVLPIVLLLLELSYTGHTKASTTLFNILLFPSTLRHQKIINLPDIVEAFAAWGIIFALAEAGFKFVFKDRIKFLSANKVLHILYISIYAITALILTIVPLDGNTDVKGLYVVLAVFFIIGYAGLGMMAIFNKLKNILLNQLGN